MGLFNKISKSFFCAMLALFFCTTQASSAETFRVLASTFPIWLFCRNVCAGAENVKIDLLIPAAAGCPHDYAPGPADMLKIEKASVLVINGHGLEGDLVRARDTVSPALPLLDAGRDVLPLLQSADDHNHGSVNPHIFAAPKQASIMVANIGQGLALHDPQNAQLYIANAAKYADRLWAMGMRIEAVGAAAPNKNIVLQHDALAYLAQNADLDVAGILPAVHNPSASRLRQLKRELKETKPVIIATDVQYSERIAELLSRETGIPCAALNPVANGPADAPLNYYEKAMEKNLAVLEKYFR